MLLAIDPHLHGLGVALFDGEGALVRAFYCPSGRAPGARGPGAWVACSNALLGALAGAPVAVVVVERMEVARGGTRRVVDPDDLLELAGVAGAVAGSFPNARHYGYQARTWKGGVPADIFARRVAGRIAAGAVKVAEGGGVEVPALPPGRQEKALADAMHAIGLGLYHWGCSSLGARRPDGRE